MPEGGFCRLWYRRQLESHLNLWQRRISLNINYAVLYSPDACGRFPIVQAARPDAGQDLDPKLYCRQIIRPAQRRTKFGEEFDDGR